jgi:hypothetical protein
VFDPKFNVSREVIVETALGKVPVKTLPIKSSVFNRDKSDIDDGIDPIKR